MSADLFSGPVRVQGGWYLYQRGWYGRDHEFDRLRAGLDWEQFHATIRPVNGEPFDAPYPRLECWYVEGEPRTYTYSGVDHPSRPMHPLLAPFLRTLNRTTASHLAYNAVFCNLYRSGQDSIGWHADDEPVLGDPRKSQIATLSFGATRRFELRKTDQPAGSKLSIDLEHGSLFVMGPGLQAGWLHQVPKQPEVTEPRISLTFRRVQ